MSVSVGQVEQFIEKMAPRSWAEEWDNPGLLVGSSAQQVFKILLSLDVTMEVIEEAVQEKADLVVCHHPLMFKPLKNLRADNQAALMPLALFRNGISLFAAHTNLDQSILSSSQTFAKLLGLEKTEFLQVTASEKLVKIVTFVPEEQAEQVRQALAAEGVGSGITDGEHSDYYSDCFYQTRGEGMFRPLSGSEPVIGEIGALTRVSEIRLESIVDERSLGRAVKALHKAHPYEEPAYDLIPLINSGKKRGYGMIGYLPETMVLRDLSEAFFSMLSNNVIAPDQTMNRQLTESSRDKQTNPPITQQTKQFTNILPFHNPSRKIFPFDYDLSSIRIAGDPKRKIKKVAIANGSGSSFVQKALFKGADLFITGDIDYHGVLDAMEGGMAVIELGHFLSEIPMIQSLFDYLLRDKTFEDVQLVLSSTNKIPWNGLG